jgi:hypothetical protein
MAYIPNTPIGTQIPAQMFTQFSDNFTELNTQYGSSGDHFEFTAAANNGKHKKSTYFAQAADPSTAATEAALYTKTLGALSELYMRRDSNGTIIQMTSRNPVVAAGLGASGQTFLPGGVEMKWGQLLVPGGGSASATFTLLGLTAFPNFGIIGFATAFGTGSQFNIGNVTQTAITIASPGGGNCFWVALGA